MAVQKEPILKKCRYLGISPAVMGVSKKESKRFRNANNRKKISEYGLQLKEKQKLKFIYGVLEKQFYHYFEIAEKMEGKAGDNLITCLESRLDSVVFRMGLALTRREARQLVVHSHYTVNGKKVNIPSYRVKVGDVIALREKDRKALEQEQHMLDLLEFGVYVTDTKTGIRNLVIQRALKPLHELVNRKAEAFRTGFQVSFRCDNGIEILVCPGTGKELLPLASLSDGEYLFTVYLLMTMLNQVIGARFLIIDNLDKLDAGNTASLLRLMEEDDGFEQIFIGTVDHADTRAALTQAGVTILPLG